MNDCEILAEYNKRTRHAFGALEQAEADKWVLAQVRGGEHVIPRELVTALRHVKSLLPRHPATAEGVVNAALNKAGLL
jgi:hypothetical protein